MVRSPKINSKKYEEFIRATKYLLQIQSKIEDYFTVEEIFGNQLFLEGNNIKKNRKSRNYDKLKKNLKIKINKISDYFFEFINDEIEKSFEFMLLPPVLIFEKKEDYFLTPVRKKDTISFAETIPFAVYFSNKKRFVWLQNYFINNFFNGVNVVNNISRENAFDLAIYYSIIEEYSRKKGDLELNLMQYEITKIDKIGSMIIYSLADLKIKKNKRFLKKNKYLFEEIMGR